LSPEAIPGCRDHVFDLSAAGDIAGDGQGRVTVARNTLRQFLEPVCTPGGQHDIGPSAGEDLSELLAQTG
jgi:hypothetical protein